MNALVKEVVTSLITEMQSSSLKWRPTWDSPVPMNHTTGMRYTGINVLLLWSDAVRKGYRSGRWATYKQWQEAGHQVVKGEKSQIIFVYKRVKKEDESGDDKSYGMLRCYRVFNADQVEPSPVTERVLDDETDRHEAAARLVARTLAVIEERNTSGPAYSPAHDTIYMPEIGKFEARDHYYTALFHELGHWTGHERRLNRSFAKLHYAYEELVAEMTSAFLCAHVGIENTRDSAAYLGEWMKQMSGDVANQFMHAASQASKAMEFILDRAGELAPMDEVGQAA